MTTKKATTKPSLDTFIDRYAEACGIVSVEDLLALHATAFPEDEVSHGEMASAAASLVGGWGSPRGTWEFDEKQYALAYSLSDSGTFESLFYEARHDGGEYDDADKRRALEKTLDRRVELVRLHERLPVKPVDDWDFPWPWRDGARDTPAVQALVDCIVELLARQIGSKKVRAQRRGVGNHMEQVASLIMTMDDGMEDALADLARQACVQAGVVAPQNGGPLEDEPPAEVLDAVRRVYEESSLWGLNGWSLREISDGKVALLENDQTLA